MNIEENQPAGRYRMQIYEAIQNTIGRTLSENEHKYLSTILKAYVAAHAPTEPTKQVPLQHVWTCQKCTMATVVTGKRENHHLAIKAKSNDKFMKKHGEPVQK